MKNKFLKSTIILMIGTMITKALGFIIKIIFTRTIKEGINIYSLILPTYSLLIAITSLGLPYAISTIIARNKHRGIHIFSSIIPISIIFNLLIILIVFKTAPYLSTNLLNNKDTYLPIISICFILPFTTISGIIKGYYFGKQNTLPNSISNVIEQLVRLLLLITIIPILAKKSIIHAVCFYIISAGITEIIQIIIYLLFLPKNTIIKISDLKPQVKIAKEVLNLSIPNVSGRLIGNISYFLEPIILTNILLFVGYSSNYIIGEYGIYNAYVIPLLTLPSFLVTPLNTTLIPEISKNHNNPKKIRSILLKCILFCLIIGIIYCLIIYFKGHFWLNILYDTNEGIEYLKLLAIFFPLFYLEGPIVSTLQGLNLAKYTMKVTLYGCIIKNITIILLSLFNIGIYSLVISEIVDIIFVIGANTKKLIELKII